MAQQVFDGDRALQRLKHELSIGLLDTDLRFRKGRDVFRQRIVKPELAVIDQHHRGNRGDSFRHRIKPEDAVRGHRPSAFDIAQAEALEIDGLTVLLDQNDRAGNLAGGNLVADVIADPLQFFARETCRNG